MSELQRSLAIPKSEWQSPLMSSALHNELISEDQENDYFNTETNHEDDSSSASSASSASSTGTIIPSSSHKLFARPQG